MPNAGHILLFLLLLVMAIVIYLMAKRPEPFACLVCADKVRNGNQFVVVQAWDDGEKFFLAKMHLCREHMQLDDKELSKAFYAYTTLPAWVSITIQRKENHE